jgi:hypothetical protein
MIVQGLIIAYLFPFYAKNNYSMGAAIKFSILMGLFLSVFQLWRTEPKFRFQLPIMVTHPDRILFATIWSSGFINWIGYREKNVVPEFLFIIQLRFSIKL